jgi:ribosomal protein S18 acetylase RimI-like enzyme
VFVDDTNDATIDFERSFRFWLCSTAPRPHGSMIAIEPITLENLPAFKAIRLRALQETSSAFGSTYARESQMSDEEWRNSAERWSGESGIGFLAFDKTGAFDEGAACGIAGAFLKRNDRSRAQLISMWTAPMHRQRGVGRMLVNEVALWAQGRGVAVLQLMVTSSNEAAMVFYERLGFKRTGRTEPYPNDPALVENEMARPLP